MFKSFYDFFFVFLNMEPYWSKNFKRYWSEPNFMINEALIEYKVIKFFGDLPKIKNLWHFEIFVNTGPYGPYNYHYG